MKPTTRVQPPEGVKFATLRDRLRHRKEIGAPAGAMLYRFRGKVQHHGTHCSVTTFGLESNFGDWSIPAARLPYDIERRPWLRFVGMLYPCDLDDLARMYLSALARHGYSLNEWTCEDFYLDLAQVRRARKALDFVAEGAR